MGGFLGALQLLLVGLKAFNVITWSWWLVFIPTYVGAALWVAILGLMIAAVIAKAISGCE